MYTNHGCVRTRAMKKFARGNAARRMDAVKNDFGLLLSYLVTAAWSKDSGKEQVISSDSDRSEH